MRENMRVFVSDRDRESSLGAVFEDDGRVAYAYLVNGETIISDVWLYNDDAAPEAPEWDNAMKAPFRNPRPYVDEAPLVRAHAAEDVTFRWTTVNGVRQVDVLLRGALLGRLAPGTKPGWSTRARVDGPLAKALHKTDGTQ